MDLKIYLYYSIMKFWDFFNIKMFNHIFQVLFPVPVSFKMETLNKRHNVYRLEM